MILVDDGLATGATMHAAIQALRQQQPARIVVAVPTASPETCEEMRAEADDVICAVTPEPFHAVGLWYQDFSQTTDEEVRELLAQRRMPEDERSPKPDRQRAPSKQCAPLLIHWRARPETMIRSWNGSARRASRCSAKRPTAPTNSIESVPKITKRLITEKGFTAVAVEADWPDAYRVNRYVRGLSDDVDAAGSARRFSALSDVDVAQHGGGQVHRVAAGTQ